jgi:hypothetical protein
MTITKQAIEALGKALAEAPGLAPDEAQEEEPEAASGGNARRALIPSPLEPGDHQMLRMLAIWRFANPAALAANSWPQRSAHGQEWRLRRFVDCGMLGRRRLRWAAARHVVWARSLATELALSPPPQRPLIPPRWNEDSARHGWMRSTVASAYLKAGWRYAPGGIGHEIVSDLANPRRWVFQKDAMDRMFPNGATTYPFDLALGIRKSDNKQLLHILVVDDPSTAPDRIISALPFEPERSSRISVRFFPIDDFTYWSKSEQRYSLTSNRTKQLLDSLAAAKLLTVPEHMGPAIAPWAVLE